MYRDWLAAIDLWQRIIHEQRPLHHNSERHLRNSSTNLLESMVRGDHAKSPWCIHKRHEYRSLINLVAIYHVKYDLSVLWFPFRSRKHDRYLLLKDHVFRSKKKGEGEGNESSMKLAPIQKRFNTDNEQTSLTQCTMSAGIIGLSTGT